MGGDGGCHPNGRKFMRGTMEKTRDEFGYKGSLAATNSREQLVIRTRTCALTHQTLDAGTPVVCDDLGNLFAKEGIFIALVEKTVPPEFEHIRGPRDLLDLVFCPNPSKPTAGNDVDWSTDTWAPYTCPVANVEMNGRFPFVAIRREKGAGGGGGGLVNVISDKALKEVGIADLQGEYGPFDADGIIKLVPTDEERAGMIAALAAKRDMEKRAKADRKAEKKKRKAQAGDEAKEGVGRSAAAGGEAKKPKAATAAPKVAATSTTSAAAKVVSEALAAQRNATVAANTYKGLFHGAGSQKPSSAQEQFIVQSGKRGLLN
mmetsp:Transcript_14584/g.34410  ORF Transcript_14584/g.34410 Transcript_14584/m.34410 type:complete len:318 (-) Transcript_14584:168-1121(-)